MAEFGDKVGGVIELGFDWTGGIVGRKQARQLYRLLVPP